MGGGEGEEVMLGYIINRYNKKHANVIIYLQEIMETDR